MTTPLFAPPQDESLAARCLRLAQAIDVYERDPLASFEVLSLTEIRQALEDAGDALAC